MSNKKYQIIVFDRRVKPLNGAILAKMFCHLDDIDETIKQEWEHPFAFQLQSITENKEITLAGRRVMQQIGEYSHWGLSCNLSQEVKNGK